MVTAVVMAGGKGKRMGLEVEKPMISIFGKPLICYVLSALKESHKLDNIIIATSEHTPQTSLYAKKHGFTVYKTPGKGYVEDLGYILEKLSSTDACNIILTITADLPLITSEIIDEVIENYEQSSKPAMSVMVPLSVYQEHGLHPTLCWEDMVPSGLNILRGNNNQQDEEVLRLAKIELAVNINSPEDIIFLEKHFSD